MTFDARAWPAKVSCQRSSGTHTVGQIRSFSFALASRQSSGCNGTWRWSPLRFCRSAS